MIDLVGRPGTDLAHRTLQLAGMLTRCNVIGVWAVAVPGQVDGGGRLSNQRQTPRTRVSSHLCVLRTWFRA